MQRQPHRLPPRWALPFLSLALAALSSGLAHAREPQQETDAAKVTLAESKADAAFRAYQASRFAEAVALYLEAYDAAPNADILYNVARIYDAKLLDRPLAITFYRRYISDPGAVVDRIQVANERLLVLREAELAATRSNGGAGAAPSAAEAGGQAPSGVEEGRWSTGEVLGAVLATTGVVALGVGAGFGVAAMGDRDTMNDLCDDNVCRDQRGIDSARNAREHAAIATVGFASGGALVALGALIYFWIGDESPSHAPERNPALGARFTELPGGFTLELGSSW